MIIYVANSDMHVRRSWGFESDSKGRILVNLAVAAALLSTAGEGRTAAQAPYSSCLLGGGSRVFMDYGRTLLSSQSRFTTSSLDSPQATEGAEGGQMLPLETLSRPRLPLATNGDVVPPKVSVGEAGPTDVRSDTIVVTGDRLRGAVAGNVPPDHILSPADILAYGVNDLGALLAAIAPRALGRRDSRNTAILINGKRVASLAAITTIPVEAIQRIDILPEAIALTYGFPAGEKLVNIVLFERYISRSARADLSTPTDGGHAVASIQPQYLAINGDSRINVVGRFSHTSELLESQRDIAGDGPRTILPSETEWSVSPSIDGSLGKISVGADGQYVNRHQNYLFGFGPAGPIRQQLDTENTHVGSIFSGQVKRWSWSITTSAEINSKHTFLSSGSDERLAPSATSKDVTGGVDLLLSGEIFDLPAGPINMSIRSRASDENLLSYSFDVNGRRSAASRRRGDFLVNVDVPIAGRVGVCEGAVGCLDGHLTAGSTTLSDAGTLWTVDGGLNWIMSTALRFRTSASLTSRAPTLEQLSDPLVVTPDVLVLDAVRNQTATVTEAAGGNPSLRSSRYSTFVAGVLWKPFAAIDLTFDGDITHSRVDRPEFGISIINAQLEAAYPERFTRDVNGNLTSVNLSPINGVRSEQTDVHGSVSFSKAIGASPSATANTIVRSVSPGEDIRSFLPPGATVIMADPGSAADKLLDDTQSRIYGSLL